MPKADIFPQQNSCALVGWTQFIENFLHESILSYPITSLKTSRQQHFTGAHKSSTSQKEEIPILLFKNWSKLIPHDRTTFLGKIDRGYLVQTQFSRLVNETFLVTGSSAEKFYQINFLQKRQKYLESILRIRFLPFWWHEWSFWNWWRVFFYSLLSTLGSSIKYVITCGGPPCYDFENIRRYVSTYFGFGNYQQIFFNLLFFCKMSADMFQLIWV